MIEFNLSDKRNEALEGQGDFSYREEDVREFIRLLKDKLDGTCLGKTNEDDVAVRRAINRIIDKLAGDKLI